VLFNRSRGVDVIAATLAWCSTSTLQPAMDQPAPDRYPQRQCVRTKTRTCQNSFSCQSINNADGRVERHLSSCQGSCERSLTGVTNSLTGPSLTRGGPCWCRHVAHGAASRLLVDRVGRRIGLASSSYLCLVERVVNTCQMRIK